MKKIKVLEWGLQHIAANYKMGASTEDLQSEAEGCIYVTEEHPDVSPAPVNDVQMLSGHRSCLYEDFGVRH